MLKINLIACAVSSAGPHHEHVGPVLGVLIGELLENEVLTPESAELREEHMKLSRDPSTSKNAGPLLYYQRYPLSETMLS